MLQVVEPLQIWTPTCCTRVKVLLELADTLVIAGAVGAGLLMVKV